MKRSVPAACCATLLILLTSCGGGSSDTGTAETPTGTTGTSTGTGTGASSSTLITLDHGGFTLQYDCSAHTAMRYEYTLDVDTGSAARPSAFTLDPDLPAGCAQQTSTSSYASVMPGWDRGHLVTSNHMDASAALIARANHMSNIVPQVSTFNQGIWLDAENVAECHRDLAPVQVVGGVVYDDISNDHFVSSHGIRTPDWFWKVIVTTDTSGATRAIAWFIPNRPMLNTLDSYLVSIEALEQRVGADRVGLGALPLAVRQSKPASTWALPDGCGLG